MQNVTTVTPEKIKTMSEKTDFAQSLAEAIMNEEIEDLGIDAENPLKNITTREQAEFYTRQYKKLQEEIKDINETADNYRREQEARIYTWRNKEVEKREKVMEYYRLILEEYTRNVLKDSNKRSCYLIEGTLQFHKQQNQYDYNDEKLIKFLNENNATKFLKPQPPKVDHAGLKRAGTEKNGKFYYDDKYVDGIVVTQRPDTFIIK